MLIKSPMLNSKFSPSVAIKNSPTIQNNTQNDKDDLNLNRRKSVPNQISPLKASPLKSCFSPNKNFIDNKYNSQFNVDNEESLNLEPIRKNRNLLKNINDVDKKTSFTNFKNYDDESDSDLIVCYPAVKQSKGSSDSMKGLSEKIDKEIESMNLSMKNMNYEEKEDIITHEGYLLKISKTGKCKNVYFKLVGKDIYCKFFLFIFKFIDIKKILSIKVCII